jgi:hypothetical protein
MLAEILHPCARPRRSAGPAFLLGFLFFVLVLAPHLSWLMIPLHAPVSPPSAASSRMAYLPGDGAKVWSPILFSLPTSAGFSGALRKEGSRIRPPLGEPLDLAMRLPPLVPDVDPPSLGRLAPFPVAGFP